MFQWGAGFICLPWYSNCKPPIHLGSFWDVFIFYISEDTDQDDKTPIDNTCPIYFWLSGFLHDVLRFRLLAKCYFLMNFIRYVFAIGSTNTLSWVFRCLVFQQLSLQLFHLFHRWLTFHPVCHSPDTNRSFNNKMGKYSLLTLHVRSRQEDNTPICVNIYSSKCQIAQNSSA